MMGKVQRGRWGSSVSVVPVYRRNHWDSIHGRGKLFFL